MQLLQVICRILGGSLQLFTESRRYRVKTLMHGVLQLGLRPGEQITHRLYPCIEFSHALLTGSIVKRLALPQQYGDDDDDPDRDHGASGQQECRRIRQYRVSQGVQIVHSALLQ